MKAKRLIEIEQELLVEKDIYFNIDLIINDKNLSKIGAMIMSYLNFESFASNKVLLCPHIFGPAKSFL